MIIACQMMKKKTVVLRCSMWTIIYLFIFAKTKLLGDKFILNLFYFILFYLFIGGDKYISPIHSFVNSKFRFFLGSMIFLKSILWY